MQVNTSPGLTAPRPLPGPAEAARAQVCPLSWGCLTSPASPIRRRSLLGCADRRRPVVCLPQRGPRRVGGNHPRPAGRGPCRRPCRQCTASRGPAAPVRPPQRQSPHQRRRCVMTSGPEHYREACSCSSQRMSGWPPTAGRRPVHRAADRPPGHRPGRRPGARHPRRAAAPAVQNASWRMPSADGDAWRDAASTIGGAR